MSEITTGTIGAAVALMTAFVTIISNKDLTTSVIRRLVSLVEGDYIDERDLRNHDLIIKLKRYSTSQLIVSYTIFASLAKEALFTKYANIICSVLLESVNRYLAPEVLKYNDQEFKAFLTAEVEWRSAEISKRLTELLLSLNKDKKQAAVVVRKLDDWLTPVTQIVLDNITSIAQQAHTKSINTKLYSIMAVHLAGLDFLIFEGARSFERLNGDLNIYLTEEK